MVTIYFKLADIKVESSAAYLLKLGKNPVEGFRAYLQFLNIHHHHHRQSLLIDEVVSLLHGLPWNRV